MFLIFDLPLSFLIILRMLLLFFLLLFYFSCLCFPSSCFPPLSHTAPCLTRKANETRTIRSADYIWLFPCIENPSNTPRCASYSALHSLHNSSTGKCRKEPHISTWFELLSFKLLRVPVLWKPSMTNEIRLHISLAGSLNGCHAKSAHSETAGAELRRLWAVCKPRPTSASWPTCRLPTVHFTPCALRMAKCFHTRKAGRSKILDWLCKWRPCNPTVAHSVHKVVSRLLHLFDLVFFKYRKFITSAAAYTQRFCIRAVIKVPQ